MKFKIFIFFLIMVALVSAQTKLDNLKIELESASGHGKLKILNELQEEYWDIHLETSLEYGKQALKYANEINNISQQAYQLSNIGKTYTKLQNYKNAIKYFSISIDKSIQANDSEQLVFNQLEIANIYLLQLDTVQAFEYAIQAEKVCVKSSNRKGEAKSNKLMGDIYLSLGDISNAYKHFDKAFSYFRQINDKYSIANINYDIGYNLLLQNKEMKSKIYLQESLKYYEELKNKRGVLKCYEALSILYRKVGNVKNTEKYLTLYFEITKEIEIELKSIENLYSYEYFNAIGETEKALLYFQKYHNQLDSLRIVQIEEESEGLQKDHEIEKRELEKSISKRNKQLKDFEKEKKSTSSKLQKMMFEKAISAQMMVILEDETKQKEVFFEKTYQERSKKIQQLKLENELKNLKLSEKTRQRNQLLGISLIILVFLIMIITRYSMRKRLNLKLEERNLELEELTNRLKLNEQKLLDIASHDPLTNLFNRRAMLERIDREKARFQRNNRHFSLIISDIDDFKKFNDTLGHDYGDYVLKTISDTIRNTIRKQDICARWGGEEFLFLLPETDEKGSRILAEKIRSMIEKTQFDFNNKKSKVSMTFGVANHKKDETIDECIKLADNALYKGKETGKNKVVCASDL